MNPLIFFRIGWMDTLYCGENTIQNGGKWVDEEKEGVEMWNFQENNGKYYGYVSSSVDLSNVIPEEKWKEGDESRPIIDVVFIAKKPIELGGGQVVVGWYKNATIFHKKYKERNDDVGNKISYVCEAFAKDSKVLEISERIFYIPKGEKRGFIGEKNVWYANENLIKNKEKETPTYIEEVKEKVRTFKEKVRKYIYIQMIAQISDHKKEKPFANLNKDHIVAIEKAAVQKTWEFYEREGYKLVSVEADNVGWDIEATKDSETLLIEVKGHQGNIIQFELTPNEYSQLKEKHKQYRVCVVCSALTEHSDLTILIPKKENDSWVLFEENGSRKIKLNEKVAAKAEEVEQITRKMR